MKKAVRPIPAAIHNCSGGEKPDNDRSTSIGLGCAAAYVSAGLAFPFARSPSLTRIRALAFRREKR